MAELVIEGSDLVVRLSRFEKVGALRGDVRVPLSSISDVGVAAESGRARRGLRARAPPCPACCTWATGGIAAVGTSSPSSLASQRYVSISRQMEATFACWSPYRTRSAQRSRSNRHGLPADRCIEDSPPVPT